MVLGGRAESSYEYGVHGTTYGLSEAARNPHSENGVHGTPSGLSRSMAGMVAGADLAENATPDQIIANTWDYAHNHCMAGSDALSKRRATESIGARIRRRRKELRWSQADLAAAANINQGYVCSIERDKANPRKRTIDALAVALNLPQGVLIGGGTDHDTPQPLETRELRLFGNIPAGPPSDTQEQAELFPVLRHQWSPEAYCLRLSLDSMEPTLKPGDIVLVQYRPGVEPEHIQGRICACLLDGEPTLKRISVEWRDGNRIVILRGDNPRVAPLLVDSSRDLSIQGVVVRLVCREL